MTFNSYLFLLLFLPVVVGGYYTLTRLLRSQVPALVWLVLASLVFYASLGAGYLLVLVGSVAGNFLIAQPILRLPREDRRRGLVLAFGILANLALLAYYKYAGFFADNANALFGSHLRAPASTYPVGLSFYTFIQIGFLLDAYAGQVRRLSFLHYVLFGTLFPYVTAGPLVRQDEVFKQLDTPVRERTGTMHLAVGATMFAMGLFKKAVLADSVGGYVGTLFGAAAEHTPVTATNAWIGVLAYTFELYFDFSGYSDMAIGLGYALGIRLPVNFNSPLKATSIVEFWRRWHMTMVRFFTNNVYTPMAAAVMRRSIRQRYPETVRLLMVVCLPVFVTFVLVGFWHGAGWGFIVSGAIHGVALSVNLVWREVGARRQLPRIPSPVGWALMMLTLVSSLVFLRAASLASGARVIAAMAGLGGAGGATTARFYGTSDVFGIVTVVPAVIWLAILAAVALLFPRNTQQILAHYDVTLPTLPSTTPPPPVRFAWRPSLGWALVIALIAGLAFVFLAGPSPFLYYKY